LLLHIPSENRACLAARPLILNCFPSAGCT
jgi:hypothetical protein